MKLLTRYEQKLLNNELMSDENQRQVIHRLDHLAEKLNAQFSGSFHFFSWFKKKELIKGLYLWGSVGRGKTLLMDLFYDALDFENKKRMHFHRFMSYIHSKLSQLQGEVNPLKKIAALFAEDYKVLCFDEFYVEDIADAMILA